METGQIKLIKEQEMVCMNSILGGGKIQGIKLKLPFFYEEQYYIKSTMEQIANKYKVCFLVKQWLSKMEIRIMVKENKLSLWLGFYENADDFKNYIKVSYDEDGNYIPSNFQESYAIKSYDLDAIESDWILERCSDVESLLAGFSGDYKIIPQFQKMLEHKNIQNYNSIVLLYNFEYTGVDYVDEKLEYIGCADVTL